MGRLTRWATWADHVIEAGWLLVLVFIPYFFNLQTARHFEPDKATTLRALVLVMLAAWAVKTLERVTVGGERMRWRNVWRAPLAIPILLYAAVFLLATVFSVDPGISWWGGYNRLQGTYTNLSYIALFALVAGNLRTRPQLDRLITTLILTAVAVSIYGLFQHANYDFLPWKGDTEFRIASTMGNSIFVAAYLIMVIPFVLFRLLQSAGQWRRASHANSSGDWLWLGVIALGLIAQQLLLVGQLKFGAAVRTPDFRYWWVFPGALAVVTAAFALTTTTQTETHSRRLPIFTLALLGLWTFFLLVVYVLSAGQQQLDTSDRIANWGLWTFGGVVGIGAFAAAALLLPRREAVGGQASRVWVGAQVVGYTITLLVLLLAVVFSQSRGPQIGLLAGLLVFIDLLLLRRWRAARAQASAGAGRWRTALFGVAALQIAAAAFLVLFNVSDAPVFNQLRKVEYVGRLGTLLETNQGTGRVRTLIWFGDDQGKGAWGLIWHNPVRSVIGYGPETMFTVYNPFYPPTLAQYEARGASPDRSHQALLDELVNKGLLGLLSYVFLILSAAVLALRLLWHSNNRSFQFVYLACLAAITAHLFEGVTGIPIVSTLMLLWMSLAVLIVGGRLDGQLGVAPVEEAVAVPVETPTQSAARTPAPKGRPARGTRSGSTVARGPVRAAPAQAGGGSFRWTYIPLVLVALLGVWFWNIKVVRADMYFNIAQSAPGNDVQAAVSKYAETLRAVEIAPTEDYYYLQLGNALIQLGYNFKLRSAQTEADVAPPRPNQRLDDLFRGSTPEQAAVTTYQANSGFQLLEYARLVLEQANNLSPTNKDHPANLGRLHALWYQLNPQDKSKIDTALKWYERAAKIAPNDVVILNEWATNLTLTGRNDEAEQKYLQSEQLDPRFVETHTKLAEFYRRSNQLAKAGLEYAKALERNPLAISDTTEPTLDAVVTALRSEPGALQAMADALRAQIAKQVSDADIAKLSTAQQTTRRNDYARVNASLGRVAAGLNDQATVQSSFDRSLALAPDNVGVHLQYAQALSSTLQYPAALQQAQTGLALAQKSQPAAADNFNKLIAALQSKIGGGR